MKKKRKVRKYPRIRTTMLIRGRMQKQEMTKEQLLEMGKEGNSNGKEGT